MLQTIHISGNITMAYTMQTSAVAYFLDSKSSITTTSPDALLEADGVGHNLIIIKGQINGGSADQDSAITLDGQSTVLVGKTGFLHASTGVEMGGAGQIVENHGTIRATDRGTWLQSNGTIDNYGLIYGKNDGVISGGVHGVTITNHANGRIVSDSAAIHIDGSYDTHSVLTNDGLINGKGAWAFFSAWGDETVINRGMMKGSIWMGEGDDIFDNRRGTVDHEILGQKGNDTLITSDSSTRLQEEIGEGSDTVKSTVSYTLSENVETLVLLGKSDISGKGTDTANTLVGNKGDNILRAMAGTDILNGGRGNDVLAGGADGDIFIFNAHNGHDTVTDFTPFEDEINLSGQNAIVDFFDLIDNHVTSSHGNVTIHISAKDSITLEHTSIKELDMSDFYF